MKQVCSFKFDFSAILAAFMLFFFFGATWGLGTFVARSGMLTRFLRREQPEVQSVGRFLPINYLFCNCGLIHVMHFDYSGLGATPGA